MQIQAQIKSLIGAMEIEIFESYYKKNKVDQKITVLSRQFGHMQKKITVLSHQFLIKIIVTMLSIRSPVNEVTCRHVL